MLRNSRLLIVLLLIGCQGGDDPPSPAPRPVATPSDGIQPLDTRELHNAFRVSDRVYSGSGPEGDAAFAELAKLGVKTIISVDGARPDVEAARRHGMTYVHLPVGYDGIPRDKVAALTQAVRDRPGPVYVHCHHGKHRGPAAVAVILLCTDPAWDPTRAEAWLETAGTDPKYAGLMSIPHTLVRPTPEELARVPRVLPSVAAIPDFTRLMVDVDARWEYLTLVKAAGWKTPKEHPDIDPPHEAVQLAELYRESARLADAPTRGPEFVKLLTEAETAADELGWALRAKPVDATRAEKAFTRSAAACTACHRRFRDPPKE